jgi:N-acetylmuramoyl-L-alanine amidase
LNQPFSGSFWFVYPWSFSMRQQLSPTGCKPSKLAHLLWALPGFLSFCLLSAPAEAAKLASWNFSQSQNRLEFTTDEAVRPRAQLISDPTRVVIDLPGTTLGRPKVTQTFGSAIQAVRIAQFERNVTRIVIEIAPGYTLDPQQVRVRGASLTQWSVELPTPQRLAQVPTMAKPSPVAEPVVSNAPPLAAVGGATQIRDIRLTPDGFFVDTQGQPPRVKISGSQR